MVDSPKVYLVMTGEYSSRQVRGVYSTPEKAEAARLIFAGEIEVMDLDAVLPYPSGQRFYEVLMRRDGAVESCAHIDGSEANQYTWSCGPMHPSLRGAVGCFRFVTWATDEQHAVKIVNERRLPLIAEGHWTDDPVRDYRAWREREEAK